MKSIEDELKQAAEVCLEPITISVSMHERIQQACQQKQNEYAKPKTPRLAVGLGIGLVAALAMTLFLPNAFQGPHRQHEQVMMQAEANVDSWDNEEEASAWLDSIMQEAQAPALKGKRAVDERESGLLDGFAPEGMVLTNATPYGREGTWKYTYQNADEKQKLFVFAHMNLDAAMEETGRAETIDLLGQYPAILTKQDGGATLSWQLDEEGYYVVLQTGNSTGAKNLAIQIGEAVSRYILDERATDN